MAEKEITVYRPNQRHDFGILHVWVVMIANIVRSRELIWQLFRRDFFAGFKKSFIGFGWVVISPIIGIISWVFMQKTGLLNPGDLGVPYPAYVLIGTSMWGLFTGFYGAAAGTLGSGGGLIMQVNYPHEALLFKETAQHLANFFISFAINIVVLFLFGIVPAWQTVFFPFAILPMFFLGAALGLIASMISIVAMDVNNFINMGLRLLLFLTPVIYSDKVENEFIQAVIGWNPLTYIVCSARDLILYGRLYDIQGYAISAASSFALFLIAWRLFYVSEDKVVERMI